MAQLISLSDEDLAQLRGELAAGHSPMVWFTSAAVGVPAGGSAKIVAFGDVAEGDFVQVRPTGSKDVLSFSPSELTRTRPPRKKAAAPRATPGTGRAAPSQPRPAAAPKPPAQPPEVRPAPAAKPAAGKPNAAKATATKPPAARPDAPRRPGRSGAGAEVTVTLNSTPDGEWTVEVTVGARRAVRALPVSAADVAKASRALPAQVAEAVDRALDSARRQQQARVEQLQAELEKAKLALRDLG